MRFIERLCPPALLYLIFVTLSVGLDVSLGLFMTAAVKTFFGLITVVVLDAFCGINLGIVSWFIVATPFVVTALATALSLGLNVDGKVAEHFKMSPENVDAPKQDSAKPADDLPASSDAL
jgi:hypothetical protein